MKKVLVVGDLHAGCREAIIPPWAEVAGMKVGQSKIQKFLWKHWKEMCDQSYDTVFVMGDCVEGTNPASKGAGQWTNELWEQVDCAVSMLEMIDCKDFRGVQGSAYHVGSNHSGDESVIRVLGGEFGPDLDTTVEEVNFYLKHKVGTSSNLKGRSTSINGDMEARKLYEYTYGKIDVHIRGHAHYTHAVWWEGILGVIAPAWKWKDDWMKTGAVTYGTDFGHLTFTVDGNEYEWGAHTFKMPHRLIKGV